MTAVRNKNVWIQDMSIYTFVDDEFSNKSLHFHTALKCHGIFFIFASMNESYDWILEPKYFGHPWPSVWPIWWLIFSLRELNMGSKNCPSPSILNIFNQFWCTSVSLCVNQKNSKTKRRIKKKKKEWKILAIFRHPVRRNKLLIYCLKGTIFLFYIVY